VLTLVVEFLVAAADVVEFRVAEPFVPVLFADVVAFRVAELVVPVFFAAVDEEALFEP
jgi:hypothetical protein